MRDKDAIIFRAVKHAIEEPHHRFSKQELVEEQARIGAIDVKARHAAWLKTRPRVIRDLAKRYPFDGLYRVKADATFGVTPPGSIVSVQSYMEGGDVTVLVLRYPPDYFEFGQARVVIDPQWLEPITLDDIPDD